jgi:hypothetical protein
MRPAITGLLITMAVNFSPGAATAGILPEYLVSARVIRVEEAEPGWIETVLSVQHTFAGPKDIVGQTFTLRTIRSGQGGNMIHPPPTTGEEGIWAVVNNRGRLVDDRMGLCPVLVLPSRKGIWPRHEMMEKLAGVIEEIQKTPSLPIRREQLKKHVFNPVPEVSAWVIHMAGTMNDDDLMQFVRGLVTATNLSLLAEVAVDETLCANDKDWPDSMRRRGFVANWLTQHNSADPHLDIAFSRIDTESQHRVLPDEYVIGLMEKAVFNESLPAAVRRSCCGFVANKAKRSTGNSQSFRSLLRYVQHGGNVEIRKGCADAIVWCAPLDTQRLEQVKAVIGSVKDEGIKQTLERAVLNE